MEAIISDIQRFSVNDGPGFRTNVYLKGCPLRCLWCHNPETMNPGPEIYWKKRLCVQCGNCLEACPVDAVRPPISPEEAQEEESGYYKIDLSRCDRCMKCVEACLYDALETVGKPMTVEAVLEEVEKDKPFYDNSGGGLTLSGGEPSFLADFAREVLEGARSRGIHSCLDTNGHCEWEVLSGLAERADIVLYDLKQIDPEHHREVTGVSNERILDNLERLTKTGREIWVRIPVIPGSSDSMDFHTRASGLLAGLPGKIARVDLLPFHNWCQDKYGWLGIDWPMREVESLDPVFLEIPAELYRSKGLVTTIGGSGFEGAAIAMES